MSAIYLVNKDSYCVIERRSRIELDGDTFRPYPHAPSSQKKNRPVTASTKYANRHLIRGYNNDSTSIRPGFDGRSTSYQRSLRSQWR